MSELLSAFEEKLNSGKYSHAGARRAIGKFQKMSKADKARATEMVDKYFGAGDEAAPKKGKPGRKPGKKAAKKVGRPPKAKASPVEEPVVDEAPVTPAVHASGRPRVAKGAVGRPRKQRSSEEPSGLSPTITQDLSLASQTITMQEAIIANAERIKALSERTDVEGLMDLAAEGLKAASRSAMDVASFISRQYGTRNEGQRAAQSDNGTATSSSKTAPTPGFGGLPGFQPGQQQSE